MGNSVRGDHFPSQNVLFNVQLIRQLESRTQTRLDRGASLKFKQ
jgi:hypothetical protein